MRVIGFDHLVVNVTDMDAALRFYGGTLGMEVLRLDQFKKGEVGFVSVRASDHSIIDLRPSEGRGQGAENIDHFCLVVDAPDMEALLKELDSQGVPVTGPVGSRWGSGGSGPSFYITDPEGNRIELKSYNA